MLPPFKTKNLKIKNPTKVHHLITTFVTKTKELNPEKFTPEKLSQIFAFHGSKQACSNSNIHL